MFVKRALQVALFGRGMNENENQISTQKHSRFLKAKPHVVHIAKSHSSFGFETTQVSLRKGEQIFLWRVGCDIKTVEGKFSISLRHKIKQARRRVFTKNSCLSQLADYQLIIVSCVS